mmetsp:Transcript_14920/g.31865  ORF Transcript_14920/g.31865 Transcript_14920/m.31865 type:complete len:106 (-) Transcript_14920:34-351(-)|eukprot:CAMPEP_0172158918 /NCGR_PEP_ID=MMETSP1050-20130122/4657_1 /TAXON_ID=233186 /ORGANISM="Cryptomonas curvata, Strain CCAP979/52" /LENGTH=105 /DNA_ID=CAMNT_0012828399 /DNA_START=90 /DNA_END=407 /DNA_ORIENTATION=-
MFADIRHIYEMLDQGGGAHGNGGVYFGGAYLDSTYTATKLGDNFDYPRDSNSAAHGAFNNYSAINAPWHDTTSSDNIRGGGAAETFSNNVAHTNSTQAGLYGHSS